MDHVVYVDSKENEMQKIMSGSKKMIIRGATGRKMPYGRVNPGDRLFFIPNDGSGMVQASAAVTSVINSDKLSEEESAQMITGNQSALQLSPLQVKRWSGKRFLVLIAFEQVISHQPFQIDRSQYGNMDDWLPVGDIQKVTLVTGA